LKLETTIKRIYVLNSLLNDDNLKQICFQVEDKLKDRSLQFHTSHYLRERKEELLQSYESKFGQKVAESLWDTAITDLAVSSIKLELLSTPLNKKVQVGNQATSRNSMFILYNYARLCKIKEHFDERVQQGIYADLVEAHHISFNVLTQPVEWKLVSRYVIYFPILLEQIFLKSLKGVIEINQIYQFLFDLSHDTSSYYHHTKVLLDPQEHLRELMHARLTLILTLKQIMEDCFSLMDLHPPTQM